MIKVRLVYACTTANFVATKEVNLPYIQEGMEISQIFDGIVTGDDEGEIFTITKIRYLFKNKIYVAFIKKDKYNFDDRSFFNDAGWKTK